MENQPPMDSQHLRRFVWIDDIGKLLTMKVEVTTLVGLFSDNPRFKTRWETQTYRIESMTRHQGDKGLYRVMLRRMRSNGTWASKAYSELLPGPCSPEDVGPYRPQFTVT